MKPPSKRWQSQQTTVAVALFLLFCAFFASIPTTAAAAAQQPAVTVSRFANLPSKLVYFDDSTVVLYHDSKEGNVYKSVDEAKSWELVNGPTKGQAYMLVQHPYDTRQAFILSDDKAHWRTTDRGKTWQTFSTPDSPTIRSGSPLEFHADEKHWDWILYTAKKCTSSWSPWGPKVCHDIVYYTTDAFASPVQPLIDYAMHCNWAKATKEIQTHPDALKRIFCIAWEDAAPLSKRALGLSSSARLFQSDDFFKTRKLVQLDMGRNPKTFAGLGPSKKYLITAFRNTQGSSSSPGSDMSLFVTTDGQKWTKADFPHGSELKENGYTIVDSTGHSMLVDVLDAASLSRGVLFTSDSSGTKFVKSLQGTRRNSLGLVDFEHLVNVDGVGIANIIPETQDVVRTKITYDDGSHWHSLTPPRVDVDGKNILCNPDDQEACSLHLYGVTNLHNTGKVYSSTAPGFIMGVGSIGKGLKEYEECDTFLSTDAGKTWRMISRDAHKYEFGDQGSVLVMVDDEDTTNHISYSFNHGKTWTKLDLGVKLRAKLLTTIPDSTSLKFFLLGSQARSEAGNQDRTVGVFIDFATLNKRKCGESDMEKWYAHSVGEGSCLMGHKQWYQRRKPDADCVIADKFHDPQEKEDPCACTDADYECDFGYVGDSSAKCVPTGPDKIPAGACTSPSDKTYLGSSGYRKIPGNNCVGGVEKDKPVQKQCDGQHEPEPGKVAHQIFEFPAMVVDQVYFPKSSSVLVQLSDNSVWQSLNDGMTWKPILPSSSSSLSDDPNTKFLTMALHSYDENRGYLITAGQRVYYTTNKGASWDLFTAPLQANGLGIPVLDFHPQQSDWLIWSGSRNCINSDSKDECRVEAFYTLNNGRDFHRLDNYVRICSWARDVKLKMDARTIFCESYRDKSGNQKQFTASNKLELIRGEEFYKRKYKSFDAIVGFATFEEYLVVAQYIDSTLPPSLQLQVSLNGVEFSKIHFPPGMELTTRAYTVLDSVTDSLFLHVTTSFQEGREWGTLLKSNSNGTFFTKSLEFVNRNSKGFVDFEKMFGLDGVAIVNEISNPDDASVSGRKDLVTRITHNDGGRWKALNAPPRDVYGNPYQCNSVGCSLHLHGFTERDDPRTTYDSPSAVGLMLGVGNVGRKLAPYTESDTFLTRDGGFTWEEVHKDAHRWEFGDQGSIIVLVNDEEPTDTVLYSLNEGLTWESYSFGHKIRVSTILTVPEDTHRRFILLGASSVSIGKSIAIYVDFSTLQSRKCRLNVGQPEADDFELWSPSEDRVEACLFGRQTYYYRRKRQAQCYVGEKIIQPQSIKRNCTCTEADFECEFNYYRDEGGKCVLHPGVQPLSLDAAASQCWAADSDGYWYERTNLRKLPYSSCSGGNRPDRGARHVCPNNPSSHGFFWWATVIASPFALAGLVGWWWNQKERRAGRGSIRLPDHSRYTNSEMYQNLALVPSFVLGLLSLGWSKLVESVEHFSLIRNRNNNRGAYGGYRHLSTDEDAEILRDFEDEEIER